MVNKYNFWAKSYDTVLDSTPYLGGNEKTTIRDLLEEAFRFNPFISGGERFPMGRPSQKGIDILIAEDPNKFYVPQSTKPNRVQIRRKKKRNIVYKRK